MKTSELMLSDESWTELNVPERRNKLMDFHKACLDMHEQAIELESREFSINGLFAREIMIPAGVALVGDIHKQEQLNIVSMGEIRVATEEGTKLIKAPCTFISPAGTKRAGYAIKDTIWTTILATEQTELTGVKARLLVTDYEDLPKILEHQ